MKTYKIEKNQLFIGREFEQQQLRTLAEAKKASIVVVHGRRRVGKTELIEQTLIDKKIFKFEGRENLPADQQRRIFLKQLGEYSGNTYVGKISANSWHEVFEALADFVENQPCVVFLEEFQWLCCYENELISELKVAWDNRLRHNANLLLILCGSSPSFMIKEVVYSKALYNRSLHEIALKPFTLNETRTFLGHRFSLLEVLNTHLAVGGIPEYLKYIKEAKALIPGLVRNSFLPKSIFSTEKNRVFVSALSDNVHYEEIVDFLADVKNATRPEIAQTLSIKEGGNLTKVLKDLELCNLIESYVPFDAPSNSTNVRYQISDNYLQFYFRFIKSKEQRIAKGDFVKNPNLGLNLAAFEQYLGLAFERWCRIEASKIATILGFGGIEHKSGSYFKRSKNKDLESKRGSQIDLIFKRADRVYTLCEIKHNRRPVNTQVANSILDKFQNVDLNPSYGIQRVLISTTGATEEVKNGAYFDRIIELEELFH